VLALFLQIADISIVGTDRIPEYTDFNIIPVPYCLYLVCNIKERNKIPGKIRSAKYKVKIVLFILSVFPCVNFLDCV
jgi:hypothetical protein